MVHGLEIDRGPSGRSPDSRNTYDDRLLLRIREGAAILGISPAKMAQLLASGEIPSLRIGRARRIVKTDLEQWVADRAAESR